MYSITKSDWKIFQEKIGEWQEAYMERLLKAYIKQLSNEKKDASVKFWDLQKRIKKDAKSPGVMLEIEKQNAVFDTCRLVKLKVIKMEDLSCFSPAFEAAVKDMVKSYQ